MQSLILAMATLTIITAQSAEIHPQIPPVWDALRVLRGGRDLTPEEMFSLIKYAIPGQDYPINVHPQTEAECTKPGYYAEVSAPSNCQTFYHCDENLYRSDFICSNGTLFNQITLVCDWFFNVDCQASTQFADYSNHRLLIQDAVLLDNQDKFAVPTLPPTEEPEEGSTEVTEEPEENSTEITEEPEDDSTETTEEPEEVSTEVTEATEEDSTEMTEEPEEDATEINVPTLPPTEEPEEDSTEMNQAGK